MGVGLKAVWYGAEAFGKLLSLGRQVGVRVKREVGGMHTLTSLDASTILDPAPWLVVLSRSPALPADDPSPAFPTRISPRKAYRCPTLLPPPSPRTPPPPHPPRPLPPPLPA